ncbi:MAG: hypothetical protein QXD13_02215 [Candidatus Pacearchaeota archaeon]
MKKPIERGYFGGIFFEFVLQDRLADAIVILPGFPSGNDFSDIIKVFFEKGYHVFIPRYRGSYQSSGVFLSRNPVDDMKFFMEHLEKGEAKSLWQSKKINFRVNKKILVSSNFGGPIACALAAECPVFSHLILSAPIWDFRRHNEDGKERDLEKMSDFVKNAYKNCYRYRFKSLTKKLRKFENLYPENYLPKLKLPVLVMHDPNDKVVAFKHTQEKLPSLKKATYLEHYFGHKISADLLTAFWKDIDKFIKVNYIVTEQQRKKDEKERALEEFEKAIKFKAEKDEKEIKKFERAVKKTIEEEAAKVIVESGPLEKPEITTEIKADIKIEQPAGNVEEKTEALPEENADKKTVEEIRKEVEKLEK